MQKNDNTISIIIKTSNSDKTLVDTLEAIRDFGEIIAIDNHSTDDTHLYSHRIHIHIQQRC